MNKKPRPINVCTFCRLRKIKCDKGKPCSNCVKYHNTTCQYPGLNIIEIDNFVAHKDLIKKVDFLKSEITKIQNKILQKGEGLPNSEDQSVTNQNIQIHQPQGESTKRKPINIYKLCNDVRIEGEVRKYSPPLTWQSILNGDPTLNVIQTVGFQDLSLDSKLTFFNQLADSGCEPDLEKMFIIKYHEDEGYEDFKLFNDLFKENLQLNQNHIINVNSIYFNTPSVAPNDSKFILVSKVHYLLPSPKLIKLLIDRFFKILYPFLPIIDETDFRSQISRILTFNNKIVVNDKLDLTYLGMLLIMLRLSYMSVFTVIKSTKTIKNTENNDSDEIKMIYSNPIILKTINLAQEILQQFDFFTTVDLPVLQLSLLLRNYESLGPEYILGSKSSQSYTIETVIVKVAQKIGVFNELSFVNDSPSLANLKRKIAVFIYSSNSITSGSLNTEFPPISLNIKLPEITHDNSNNRDIGTESLAVDLLTVCLGCRDSLRTSEVLNSFDVDEFHKNVDEVNKVLYKGSIRRTNSGTNSSVNSGPNSVPNSGPNSVPSSSGSHSSGYIRRQINSGSGGTGNSEELGSSGPSTGPSTSPWPNDSLNIGQQIINTFSYRYELTKDILELSIYFHICNGRPELASEFFGKSIEILFTRIFPNFDEIFNQAIYESANKIDLIIIPNLLHLLHRGFLVILSFLTRVKLFLLSPQFIGRDKDSSLSSRYNRLVELSELLNHTINILFQFTFNLSNRYYYGWRIFKMLKYYVRCINLLDLKMVFAGKVEGEVGFDDDRVRNWVEMIKKFNDIRVEIGY